MGCVKVHDGPVTKCKKVKLKKKTFQNTITLIVVVNRCSWCCKRTVPLPFPTTSATSAWSDAIGASIDRVASFPWACAAVYCDPVHGLGVVLCGRSLK